MNFTRKNLRTVLEIIVCFFIMPVMAAIFNGLANILKADGLWTGILAYLSSVLIIILYVTKAEQKPLAAIGLKKFSLSDIPSGLLLGFLLFVIQQIPLLMMKMDYSAFAYAPDWGSVIIMSLYCIFCVGLSEEIIFRGFILHKTQELCKIRVVAVIMNCLLFYAIHWRPSGFVFGEFFSTTVNTVILCIYYYKSKNKSIVPLIIAHGFYDILTSCLLPAFLFLIFGVG